MCGVFGFIGRGEEGVLESCARTLWRRGPDDFGSYTDSHHDAYLAHHRLSIVDLSSAGHQPMANEDGTLWLTFNGEIYNFRELREQLIGFGHVFRSNTDSETILHAYEEWGADCLSHLNGMFAFGLWDAIKGELFLARDRLGVKPLYYWEGKGSFAFASEPKALLDIPGYSRSIDEAALISYLVYGYIPGKRSIWKGIRKLPPGNWLRYRKSTGASEACTYWQIPIVFPTDEGNSADTADRLESLIADATACRLVSDVPLGIFLSGGIDSSAIAAFAARPASQLRTFFVGFEGAEFSERHEAQLVAKSLDTVHREDTVRLDHADDLEFILRYLDEPLGDSSIVPMYLLCRKARDHVKVALSGDGGDEIFAGYAWYFSFYRYARVFRSLGRLRAFVNPLAARRLGIPSVRGDFDVYRGLTSPRFELKEIRQLFPALEAEAFPVDENEPLRRHYHPELEPFRSWQYVDASTFLVDDILTKVDRASMANSLEVRSPFLDYRLVEFAFSLSHHQWVHGSTGKQALRKILASRLPAGVLQKPKRGFSCPVNLYWPSDALEARVRGGRLVRDGILAREPLNKWLDRRSSPHQNAKLWLLALLEIWYTSWLAA